MICAFCKNEIENDSFFCDQCGKEIKVCPQCGTPGKGKICTEHGKKLITAKEKAGGNQPGIDTSNIKTDNTPKTEPETVQQEKYVAVNDNPQDTSVDVNAPAQEITFTNNAINVILKLGNDDIIGRKKGKYASIFGQYKQISGAHAKISFSNDNWYIIDLDSSNGTKYNGVPLTPNTATRIVNGSRVIIANIEFIVGIESNDSADMDKTVRI